MIACVWPDEIVRSTPRRTSRVSPAASVTPTCRSRISRVDICVGSLHSDEHVVAVDLDLVGRHWLGGGWSGRLPTAQVEARPVQPALHGVVVDLAFGQRYFFVRADVVQREHLAAGADQAHRYAVDLDAERAFVRQVRQRTDALEVAHASSVSIAAVIRSRSSGTSIWPINSP